MNNNKGLSLIEILVVMGLIGVLATIAIPAYDNYRNNANTTVLKADVGNGYKAYHAFNAIEGHFCATLKEAGLDGLQNSSTYKGEKSTNSFVGFGAVTDCTSTDSTHTLAKSQYKKGAPPTHSACVLKPGSFIMGVSNTFGGDKKGFYVTSTNSSPQSGGATCGVSACTEHGKTACESSGATKHACHGAGAGGATWTPLANLCQ